MLYSSTLNVALLAARAGHRRAAAHDGLALALAPNRSLHSRELDLETRHNGAHEDPCGTIRDLPGTCLSSIQAPVAMQERSASRPGSEPPKRSCAAHRGADASIR